MEDVKDRCPFSSSSAQSLENLSTQSKQIQLMFDKISPTYDLLNRMLSFGQDVRWREHALRLMPEISTLDGVHCDIACGTGDVLIGAAENRKDYSQHIGFDLSQGMLNVAQKRCLKKNIEATFIHATAENLPCSDHSANCVTIAFGLRNIDDRAQALREFYRILKPRGVLIILDFFEGEKTLFSKFFKFYFKTILPKIAGIFADKAAYTYLPNSVAAMPSADGMRKMLIDTGFCSYVEQYMWLSGAVRLFIAKKL